MHSTPVQLKHTATVHTSLLQQFNITQDTRISRQGGMLYHSLMQQLDKTNSKCDTSIASKLEHSTQEYPVQAECQKPVFSVLVLPCSVSSILYKSENNKNAENIIDTNSTNNDRNNDNCNTIVTTTRIMLQQILILKCYCNRKDYY